MQKPYTQVLVLFLLCIAGGVLLFHWGSLLLQLATNPEHLRQTIDSAGVWAPLLFILFQIAQVFIAPLPGQLAVMTGGYLFGPVLGTVYALFGATVASALVFYTVRMLGDPVVRYFVPLKIVKQFDYLMESKGVWVFFIIFLLPAFPDDLICFIAGLTKIPIKTLVVISVIGRLPSYFMLSYVGGGVAEGYWLHAAIMTGVLILVFAVVYGFRNRLTRLVRVVANR